MERPENAIFNKGLDIWILQPGEMGGDYYEWYADGKLSVKRLLGPQGEVLEHYKYINDRLTYSEITNYPVRVATRYYTNTDTPVIKDITVDKDNYADVTTTFFDTQGQTRFTVRHERPADHSGKRYFNDILIAEGEDGSFAKYYGPDGTVIIDYCEGVWTNHSTPVQQIIVTDDNDDHFLKRWDTFLPDWHEYEEDHMATITDRFEDHYQQAAVRKKFKSLPLHPLLEEALWNGPQLSPVINGLLSEDEAIAAYSSKSLWGVIADQGLLLDVAYKVGDMLIQLIPQQPPAVQSRLTAIVEEILNKKAVL
jgi:hypothetical protein